MSFATVLRPRKILRPRKALRPLPLSLCFLFLALVLSCSREPAGPPFFESSGRKQTLVTEPAGRRRYQLRRPVRIEGSGLAFYLTYRSLVQGRLILHSSPSSQGAAPTVAALRDGPPATGSRETSLAAAVMAEQNLFSADRIPYRQLIPLTSGSSLGAFEVDSSGPPGGSGVTEADWHILESGITRLIPGIQRQRGALTIGAGITRLASAAGTLSVGLGPEFFEPVEGKQTWQLLLRVNLPATDAWRRLRALENPSGMVPPREALITLAGPEARTQLRLRGRPGMWTLYLYPGIISDPPERITLSWESRLRPTLHGLQIGIVDPWAPLPADPGAILHYHRRAWRRQDFELFSWDRFPEVLILDTADYAVQARMFKRLAFFVEKRGYRGRLVTEEEVRHLHGYNAHDYRAEDLSRFFSRTRERSFPLTEEELLLRRILLHNGVIHRSDDGYLPGRGVVLSISRSSPPALRRHLLTHEGFHGIFFMRPDYRRACSQIWEKLSAPERAFWRLFLDWAGYDTADAYLVVNEFQAYLLQQERAGLSAYFRELSAGRLIRSYPRQEVEIRSFLRDFPHSFRRAFDRLELALGETAGLEGGKITRLQVIGKLER